MRLYRQFGGNSRRQAARNIRSINSRLAPTAAEISSVLPVFKGRLVVAKVSSCLIAALCTGIASAQIAYVYIPNGASTYAYDVSSTGKLKAIKGSPFPTTGDLVGSNGSYFITVDVQNVYSYAVASKGVIGSEFTLILNKSTSDKGVPSDRGAQCRSG